jgi:phosphoribosylglycinamide formyltransferase 1
VEHTPPNLPLLRLAMLISGSGSTLRNILELSAAGRLPVRVVGVAASRECSGLAHCREFSVPCAIVKRAKPFDAAEFSARVTAALAPWAPQLIALGGFLSLYLPPQQYRGRVINIHPALLPAFGGPGMYGDRVHEAVLASGARVTGCSVHFVDALYDHGAIIAQQAVAVCDGDDAHSLGERVRLAERQLYPTVLRWFAQGRVALCDDGRVTVAPAAAGPAPDASGS